MAGAILATKLVLRLGLDRTIGVGVLVITAGGLCLALAVATGVPGLWLVAAMALYLAGVGLAMPQAMAGALTPFPDRAGTAASLMGLVQQAVAAIAAGVLGGLPGPIRLAGHRRCGGDELPDFFAVGVPAPSAGALENVSL